MFRAYSAERRDRAPLIETEDFRDEGARRFWDDYSPPYFGFKPGPNDTYHWNSETFALAAANRYWAYWSNRISNPDPAHSKWSGYASIYFSDSNADGRQQSSEVARVSGKVDAVRLPKEIYFAHRVMQNARSRTFTFSGIGRIRQGTKKTVYVIANTEVVELFLDGKSWARIRSRKTDMCSLFLRSSGRPGRSRRSALTAEIGGRARTEDRGTAKRIKLTPIVGPDGWQADGEDVALVDVEVVDANGHRCPTDDARVDFEVSGPAIWRGGYNSGKADSTNNLYLNTECGINRVAMRAMLQPGSVRLKAIRAGLEPAEVSLQTNSVKITDGLSEIAAGRLSPKAD